MGVVTHYRSMVYGREVPWGTAMVFEMGYGYLWAAVSPFVFALSKRFRLGRGRDWVNILIHLLGAVFFAAITKVAWDFLIFPMMKPWTAPEDLYSIMKSVLSQIDFGIIQYFSLIIGHHALEYYRAYEEGRYRSSQLEARLAQAQLKTLKMQLHPHFLFNTLHALSELMHENPVTAERMIIRLSDFLRLSLDHVALPEVALSQELDFLKRYLEIEQMRFEDRLTISYDIDPNVLRAQVPNLILQPLVENALKHGIANRRTAGLLRIVCREHDEKLSLLVSDNGPDSEPLKKPVDGPVREGVGLNNTRTRLEHLYGGAHKIELRKMASGGFEVCIVIPLRLGPPLVEVLGD